MAKAPIIEVAPEVDSLENAPLPREQQALFAHHGAEQEMQEAFAGARMHHAWLLGGPKGIGKATLAFRFARHILGQGEGQTPQHTTAQISAGSHADLLHLRRPWDDKGKRFKRDLPVSEVRRTLSFFGSTAAGGNWRICIVDAADDMNASAANALLKILEEPPKQALFLLLSHNPGRLLPTIRSRCRRLDLRPLSAPQILEALAAMGEQVPQAGEDRRRLTTLADGSLRKALLLCSGSALQLAAEFEALMAHPQQMDFAAAHKFADKVAARGAEDAWETFQDLARNFLSANLRKDTAATASALVTWAQLWEKMGHAVVQADALNLDRKQTVLSFFMDVRSAARG
ncbi:DNA polymerase III subunit delta' [Polycladidibacter hongkongensis]|uniref:DNA polymerase III subunit delta' n=1 Tax=Polycladidibacter hongkongensis TaxID=1647556 RepID=UPI000833D87F|nr:DNA polymerase III subunit delta' [Pseudovibrio hongkongensis]